MNGVLCINKPEGFTSFDVIAKLRGILKTRKLGHTGTLDPMATGVLPVLAGTAAKACDMLLDHDKEYEAKFKLGIITDTQDIWGAVAKTFPKKEFTKEDIEKALCSFRGDILQIPPMYSAVSIGGKRLYELARQGIVIDREARPVTVYELTLLDFNGEEGSLRISCSKGTYIRTLINDIGETLGTGAVMTALMRTRACGFTLEDCTDFASLEALNGDFSSALLPVDRLFSSLPEIKLPDSQARLYKNGVRLDLDRVKAPDGDRFRIYGGGEFIGVGKKDEEGKLLISEKYFYPR